MLEDGVMETPSLWHATIYMFINLMENGHTSPFTHTGSPYLPVLCLFFMCAYIIKYGSFVISSEYCKGLLAIS